MENVSCATGSLDQMEEPVEDEQEALEPSPFSYSITSYGADFLVDGLVTRLEAKDIIIPTFDPDMKLKDGLVGFQRQFIWTKQQCDRFIESLLLGLPVPGIFLVKESDNRLLVLDGQQRLRTVQSFYKGILRGKEFILENVQKQFIGLKYAELDRLDKRKLDDSVIHATVIRQDEPTDDQSSIYQIFERLNTGGTNLQPQEIRVALYHGPFINLLRSLNENPDWRALYGRKSNCLKDQELILRFFAFLFWRDNYRKPIKDFLNRYVEANRNFQDKEQGTFEYIFVLTCNIILRTIGKKAFRLKTAINAAMLDSVMVSIARRIIELEGKVDNLDALRAAYQGLLQNSTYLASLEKSTSDEENVKTRFKEAFDAMKDVG